MKSRQFIWFLFAGGAAALLNFGSRILLSHWMPYLPAIIVAYVIGMVAAFVLNRVFVFTSIQSQLHTQIIWFILVNLAAVAQTAVISILLASYALPTLGFHEHLETIAHAVGVVFPVATSYLGHKHFTFRRA